jgi:hypothetical protein
VLKVTECIVGEPAERVGRWILGVQRERALKGAIASRFGRAR